MGPEAGVCVGVTWASPSGPGKRVLLLDPVYFLDEVCVHMFLVTGLVCMPG